MSFEPGSTPMATAMSCTSCEASTSADSTSQVLRILPRNGITAWNSRSRACFAEPPAESPSTRNSSVTLTSCITQSASLPGRAGPPARRQAGDPQARELPGGALAGAGALDGQLRDALARLHVLVQPQTEGVVDHAAHERRALARGQPLLGLPGELRIGEFDRQEIRGAIADVLGGELDAARQEIAEFAELAHGVKQPLPQTRDMRAAFRRRHQVDVTLDDRFGVLLRQPVQRPVHRLLRALHLSHERLRRQQFILGQALRQISLQTVFVAPFIIFFGSLIMQT